MSDRKWNQEDLSGVIEMFFVLIFVVVTFLCVCVRVCIKSFSGAFKIYIFSSMHITLQ